MSASSRNSKTPPFEPTEDDLLDDPEPLPDNDTPWKELIAAAFPDFMEFFHPDAAREIDWSRGHERLDAELQKIAVRGDVGRRYADQLMKVWLLSGEEQWVLVHVEVQGTRDHGFPRRMFEYRTRIHHRFGREVASIAILADDVATWRPTEFSTGRWGSSTSCTFTTVKLLDYAEREQELLDHTNVFGLAVVAHLRAQASRRQWPLRLKFKLELTVLLGEKGYPEDKVRQILSFVDWLMLMPRRWEARYNDEVAQIQESKRMPYVTSFERRGIEKGKAEGLQEGRAEGRAEGQHSGKAELLVRQLERRFGSMATNLRERVTALPATTLDELADLVLSVESKAELEAWLAARAPVSNT